MVKMQEVRDIAKEMGIKTSRMSKLKLIHAIQLGEGNFDCFASATDGACDQASCKWRKECFSSAKKLHS